MIATPLNYFLGTSSVMITRKITNVGNHNIYVSRFRDNALFITNNADCIITNAAILYAPEDEYVWFTHTYFVSASVSAIFARFTDDNDYSAAVGSEVSSSPKNSTLKSSSFFRASLNPSSPIA